MRKLPPRVQYLVMREGCDGQMFATLDGLAAWNKQSEAIKSVERNHSDPENYDVVKYVRASQPSPKRSKKR